MKNSILATLAVPFLITFYFLTNSNDGHSEYKTLTLEDKTERAIAFKDFSDYRNWYQITHEKPNTGDIIGVLGSNHKGPKGYREVYINKIGEATNKGTAPYSYPAGTVIVKEQYSSKEKWEEKTDFKVTVMVKLDAGSSPETGDWGYTSKIKDGKIFSGNSSKARFCGGCHIVAQDTDYVFMNSDLLNSERD